mgnify:CR=1 FL=1
MLINTVLAFTRELLPVFILLALVLQLALKRPWPLLRQSLVIGIAVTFVLSTLLGRVTQWFDGNGLELLFMLLQLLTLLALFALLFDASFNRVAAAIAIGSQVVLAGINLMLFALTVSSNEPATEAIWLGAVLGLGIGCSIAVLLYQLLAELSRLSHVFIGLMMALTAARQSSEIIALLRQTDWLALEQKLWDSGVVLGEQTELGVFFHAWFGYEATPDVIQVSGWLLTFSFMLAMWCWRRVKQ